MEDDTAEDFVNFQYELYLAGMAGRAPRLPASYEQLERRARQALDEHGLEHGYAYVAGGAASEDTMRENAAALRRWRIVPRHQRDVSQRDLSTSLLGIDLPAPVMLAPIGVQAILHPEAELAVARAAASVGIPMVLSTVSSRPLEAVAEALGATPRWFQLYMPADRELTRSLVARAEDAGYAAVVVTLDARLMAWRPRDLEDAYLPFLRAEGVANYRTDEVFTASLDAGIEDRDQAVALRWAQVYSDVSQTWDDIAWLCGATDLPVLVKGVLHPDDARAAVDAGVAGIGVSNHGGRQVDGAIGALDALPGVVDAVAGEVPVVFDSGIRTGADAVKALCLGAAAVLLGRPYVWGLAADGEDGVRHVVRSFLADLDLTMAMSGLSAVKDLGPEVLARPS